MTANPTDKPLDCVGTAGHVGKHDFQPSKPLCCVGTTCPVCRHSLPPKNSSPPTRAVDGPLSTALQAKAYVALRQKLGDTAIQAIMEGEAMDFRRSHPKAGSLVYPLYERGLLPFEAARLDKPTSEGA